MFVNNDKTPLFEARVDAGSRDFGDVDKRREFLRQHLAKLGMDTRDTVFFQNSKTDTLSVHFPSGLIFSDDGNYVTFSKAKDFNEDKARSEISVIAGNLMRRGWNTARLSINFPAPTPLTKVFSESVQTARNFMNQEMLASIRKNGKSVA